MTPHNNPARSARVCQNENELSHLSIDLIKMPELKGDARPLKIYSRFAVAPQPQLNLQTSDMTKHRERSVHRRLIKFATFARIIRTPAALGNLNYPYHHTTTLAAPNRERE